MGELPDDQRDAIIEKSPAKITKYKHYLNKWVLPRWQKERVLAVHPFEVENWFKQIEREHQLETSTLAEIRKVMNLVYQRGQRHGILPERMTAIGCCSCDFRAIWIQLPTPNARASREHIEMVESRANRRLFQIN